MIIISLQIGATEETDVSRYASAFFTRKTADRLVGCSCLSSILSETHQHDNQISIFPSYLQALP